MVAYPEFPLQATSHSSRAFAVLLLVAAAMSVGAGAVQAQQIRGRVVDEQSRSALVEVTVTLRAVDDSTVIDRTGTAADGFFTVRAPGPGEYRVVVERIGYVSAERDVTLGDQRELIVPAFVLSSRAVALEEITAEARSQRSISGPEAGFGRASLIVAGERLAKLEQMGASMDAAVRELGAGLRARDLRIPGQTRSMTCVETTRRMPTFRGGGGGSSGCDMVAIVLDGVTIPNPLEFFQYLDLREFESIQYMPAPEAGPLYGMEASANGALVLWTRGKGPYRSDARGGGSSQ